MMLSVDNPGLATVSGNVISQLSLFMSIVRGPFPASLKRTRQAASIYKFLACSHSNSFVVKLPPLEGIRHTSLSLSTLTKMNDSAYWLIVLSSRSCRSTPPIASLRSAIALLHDRYLSLLLASLVVWLGWVSVGLEKFLLELGVN